jgi:hypothetical protein
VQKNPLAVFQHRLKGVIGVAASIARGSVAHFEASHEALRVVAQAMGVSWAERCGANIGLQVRMPLQHVDAFVLSRVCGAQARHPPRRQTREANGAGQLEGLVRGAT